MNDAPIPYNDAARLASLREYGILDTPREAEYDAIAGLAAAIAGVPISAISLVDADRQWFKTQIGLGDVCETPRSVSFCGHAITSGGPLLVPDAAADPRFADNPLVTGAPHIRFYYGIPLVNADGHALGTLCVIDRRPRQLSESAFDLLLRLASVLISLLEGRHALHDMAHLTDYFEQLANDVYLFDADSRRLIYASSRVLTRFGALPKRSNIDVATVSLAEIDEWQGLAEIQSRLGELATADGASLRYETDVFHPGGQPYPAEVVLSRISGRCGDTLCAVVCDISERHAHRRALQAANDHLELQVTERTRDLYATLAQMERMAGTMTHDLRAPLHAILGFTGIVAGDDGVSEQNRQYLGRVQAAARRMQGMIEQIIAYLRNIAQPMSSEYLDLEGLIRLAWSETAIQRTGHDAELCVAELPPARGDMSLIRRVIDNLLSNALKYARPDIALKIEIAGEQQGDMNAYFVRDNGIGFAPAQAAQLFEPFRRLHADRGIDGIGLGLTSVAHSVGRHGGQVWAQANPEGGALFAFTLPAHQSERRGVDAANSTQRP